MNCIHRPILLRLLSPQPINVYQRARPEIDSIVCRRKRHVCFVKSVLDYKGVLVSLPILVQHAFSLGINCINTD